MEASSLREACVSTTPWPCQERAWVLVTLRNVRLHGRAFSIHSSLHQAFPKSGLSNICCKLRQVHACAGRPAAHDGLWKSQDVFWQHRSMDTDCLPLFLGSFSKQVASSSGHFAWMTKPGLNDACFAGQHKSATAPQSHQASSLL